MIYSYTFKDLERIDINTLQDKDVVKVNNYYIKIIRDDNNKVGCLIHYKKELIGQNKMCNSIKEFNNRIWNSNIDNL